MTALYKQALRECFEKWWEINYHNGKPPRFGWEYWRDGEGYQIDDDESELDGMWESWQAAHSEKLEAAEKRIAALESDIKSANERYENRAPTEWAYNQACAAIEKHRLRADNAEAQLAELVAAGIITKVGG